MFGTHVARCGCCGRSWMCGDCIPSVCFQCRDGGHNGGGAWSCPICKPENDRKMAELQAQHEAEQARKENEFGYGILK